MMLAIIRLKGKINLSKDIEMALRLLRINKKHHCVVLQSRKDLLGTITKVQPYITWGELDEKTLVELLIKRGRLAGNKRVTDDYIKEKIGKNTAEFARELMAEKIKIADLPGFKPVFRLKPPTKGLEENGMKRPYSLGGATGYRGKNINELLMRMI